MYLHGKSLCRKIILITILFLSLNRVSAQDVPDRIMSADIPVFLGEENFLQRINEKTGGQREPVGLVLSGGSARAFAHIGVLRRLEELGIVPDFIVANSMGAIVGLMYAAGMSPDMIQEAVNTTNIGELFNIVMPLDGGVMDVSLFSGLIRSYLGNPDLSELPIPVMVVCEDIRSKRQIRISEGPLLTVMEASYALPVYFNPVEMGDYTLIDGGISNLVPLDVAYKYSDRIIAATAFYDNPKLDLKSPLTILNIAMDVGKSRSGISQLKYFDPLLIRCDVEHYSFMSFNLINEISEAGYSSAKALSSVLSEFTTGGVPAALEEVRNDYRQLMDRANSQYRYLESIPVAPAGIDMVFTAMFPEGILNDFYLDGGYNAGLGADFKAGSFGLQAGAAAEVSSLSEGDIHPLLFSGLSYDPFYFLRLRAGAGFSLTDNYVNITGISDILNSGYYYGQLRLVPFAATGFRTELNLKAELGTDASGELSSSLYTGTLGAVLFPNPAPEKPFTIGAEAGIQAWTAESVFGLAEISLTAAVPGTRNLLLLEDRALGRYPFSSGTVPLFKRDSLKLCVEQTAGSTISPGSLLSEYPQIVFNELRLLFNPYMFEPAFSEIVIFQNIRAGAYGVFAYTDRSAAGAGFIVNSDVSLIGLKPVPLNFYAGWDFSASEFCWGFSFSKR